MELSEESFDNLLVESDDDVCTVLASFVEEDEIDAAVEREKEEEISDEEEEEAGDCSDWKEAVQKFERWKFNDSSGLNYAAVKGCREPIDFYDLFVNEDLLGLIVKETNRYAFSKDSQWEETSAYEMRKFLALTMQMGVVKLPAISNYWSTDIVFGGKPVGASVMTRKRFERLLANLHLADNETADKTNCLYKISGFLDLFVRQCQLLYRPAQNVFIDENLIPFGRRTRFQQNNLSNQNCHSIKILKLYSSSGYTFNIMVYAGNLNKGGDNEAGAVVVNLMEGLLDSGRRLFADSWCATVPLAKKLLTRKTDLVGIVRKDRKGLPKKVSKKPMRRGCFLARQDPNGIMVLKWKDDQEVLVLSTVHDDSVGDAHKPQVIIDYNDNKSSVTDFSDETAPYLPFIRKTTKWYIRVLFHVLCQIAVMNAWHIYNSFFERKMKLIEFKISVIRSLLELQCPSEIPPRHTLEEVPGPKRHTNRRCVNCYRELSRKLGAYAGRTRAKQENLG
ncbi:unnamed protein product [Enterobius vermicularis]|uniref:DDE_Tnp_1_7 domain-containing protein n=1 Tax=Enterobius vermicularis TaxID=51028 RepID=A0A0N4UUN0_ENTVE|nr:unnamed protein product [Enterobius vermicularis]